MNLFKKFKKKTNGVSDSMPLVTNLSYMQIPIEVEYNIEESMEHLSEDFEILKKEGIDKLIKQHFIPWFKSGQFQNQDDELIFMGLKIYSIVYCYAMIDARYSSSKQQEMAGQFDFFFESGNDYTANMMESVAMQIYVQHGRIVKVDGYEV